MQKPTLFIWKGTHASPKTATIAQDYTLRLFLFYIAIFMLYGAVITAVFNFAEHQIEAAISTINTNWLFDTPEESNTVQNCINIAEELLDFIAYLSLALIIKVIGKIIMSKSKKWNDNEEVFSSDQLKIIVNRSLILTALFFVVYAFFGRTSSDANIATSFSLFVVSGFISLDGFELPASNKNNRKERKVHNKDINRISIYCLIAIPLSIFLEHIANRHERGFIYTWAFFLIMLILLWIVVGADRRRIKKIVLERENGNNVLIFGPVSYSTLLQNTIFRSIKRQYTRPRKVLELKEYRKYDTIIIVNPFDDNAKTSFLRENAGRILADNGVIIVPAYTATRKKSPLMSPENYKAKLQEMGFRIKCDYVSKFKTITYIELVNP